MVEMTTVGVITEKDFDMRCTKGVFVPFDFRGEQDQIPQQTRLGELYQKHRHVS